MDEGSQAALRVALLADEAERNAFRSLLESEGFEVVVDSASSGPLPEAWNGAEVLLLGVSDQPDLSRVQDILQRSPVPVLVNQGGIGGSEIWSRRLIGKLHTLAERAMPVSRISAPHSRPELRVVQDERAGHLLLPRLIVLGASIGGPKAVARFLQALPEDLPVVFLLAQHISEAFQDLLVEQLDRCSDWPVALIGDGQTIAQGQVWLVPAENSIEMTAQGAIRRSRNDWGSAHRPNIDAVLSIAAQTYGARCGAIMFSGIGSDGARGCEAIARHGGFVWAQSPESCVIPNLPDAARRSCNVEFSGTPEELAARLASRCQMESLSIN